MENKKTNILITGANGFIGNYLRKEFADCNINSLGLQDNNEYKADLRYEVPMIENDFKIVIHNAGTADETNAMASNYQGTINLLKGLDNRHPQYFVYISSVHIYGLGEGENISETTSLNPSTEYGRSKMLAEKELQHWCDEKGVVLTILRPAMVFGNGIHGKAKEMFEAIIQGRYFHVSENKARRSVVMADDVAKAIRLLYDKGGIYNITDGYDPTVIELADSMAANASTNKRIMSCPLKWLKIAAKIGDTIPPLGKFLNSEKLTMLTSTRTFSNQKLIETTGIKLYKTTDVIARRSTDYPYEYND